jgi:transposase
MAPRAKLKPLTLTRDEQEQLEQWVRGRQDWRPSAMRARIVLSCHAGWSNRESAKQLKVTAQTVGKWRAALNQRCAGGGSARQDAARKAAGRRALEQPSSRRNSRDFAADGAAHLARL